MGNYSSFGIWKCSRVFGERGILFGRSFGKIKFCPTKFCRSKSCPFEELP
uniref:Uncharacterized protein n=1 Tax=Meloidogyne enterolobii TaxID=390850 RepID=A0A6V7W9F3_MELEN|nr:unnamed protein product [Meloidogyne enterolobii]